VFADVDPASGNISASTIAAVLTSRTRAVICVHLAGWPCDMDPIMQLAASKHLAVIEDCAQAHGARYRGRSVGSIGHIGAWSFCQDKIMTTGGEGGMVTTNDRELWSRMWSFKDHGKSWEAMYERQHGPGFRWVHDSFGTNWRMLEMQAAIGRVQLRLLPEWTRARLNNAMQLTHALLPFSGPDGPIRIATLGCASCDTLAQTECQQGCVHGMYKYYFYVRSESLADGWSRDRIIQEVTARGVPCYHGSCSEVYLERAFDGTPWRPEHRLPVARQLGESSVMLLVHPTITPAQIELNCDVLRSVLEQCWR